jgi:hypothetical protein
LDALRALDLRLAAATEIVKLLFGPDAARDLFRGLHITPADADRALSRPAVAPLFGPLGFNESLVSVEVSAQKRFDRIREAFGLSSFDLDVLLVALAPEVDARYERLYAFIQDDVARKRPTVDLTLNLLCASVPEKLERLGRFAADAPLVRNGLVRLLPSDGQADSVRLAASIRVDEVVLGFLLGHEWLDSRLACCCRFLGAASATGSGGASPAGLPLVIYIQSEDLDEALGATSRRAGDRRVLAVDVEQALCAGGGDWDSLLAAVFRTALLGGETVLIHRADLLLEAEHSARLGQLLRRAASHREDVYFDGPARWEPADRPTVPVVTLERTSRIASQSVATWEQALIRQGAGGDPAVVERLAATFPSLGAAQIGAAVLHAVREGRGNGSGPPSDEALLEGARLQTRGALRGLAERVPITPSWDELVLPPGTLAQLREISLRVTRRATVMDDWGFAGRRYGRGTTVLFSGSSGTGKTFAAAVLAAEIGQDLYRIDLASVVSKYIGETEKKLAQLFDGAERANCVLLFDEADALFGKRSDVRDAHDRYANQEVAYLLQRVERFAGLAILTSNMSGSIDPAFARRFDASVFFELPDLAARHRLWERALPAAAPRDGDLDLALLARKVRISGGVIGKAALAAAFLAAEEGTPIAMRHLLHALRREVASLGIAVPALLTVKPA